MASPNEFSPTFKTRELRSAVICTLYAPQSSKDAWFCPEGWVIDDVTINGFSSGDIKLHGVRSRQLTEFPTPSAQDKQNGMVGIAIEFEMMMYPTANTFYPVRGIATDKLVGLVMSNTSTFSDGGCQISVVMVPTVG